VVFSSFAYSLTYGFSLVFQSMNPVRLAFYFALCVGVGVLLAVIAALYPSRYASRMLPAHALRSEV
jgi:ABC-type antimicrobial peptide transport system permease subunit